MNRYFVSKQMNKIIQDTEHTAVFLGSANLPFPELSSIPADKIDYNAAEGFLGRRLFPGCSNLDLIEEFGATCMDRLTGRKNKFKYSFNPLSGTQANQIVYNSILQDGDTVLALSLACGGHESHLDFIKKYFHLYEYHLVPSGVDIDYDEIEKLCQKYHPRLIIAGASSFPLAIRYDLLNEICLRHNVLLLADISHTALYVFEGLHPDAFRYADFVTFTTHKTTRGPRGAILAYRKDFSGTIERSIFPLTQGAPIFSQICKKVLMLEILSDYDRIGYCNRIFHLTAVLMERMKEHGITFRPGYSETHLCTADIGQFQPPDVLVRLLEDSGIYVTACSTYKEGRAQPGIRFGTMWMASLGVHEADISELADIIARVILSGKKQANSFVRDIMKPYYDQYWRDSHER